MRRVRKIARFSCPSTARTATTCPHDTATRYPEGHAVLRTPRASCHAPAHRAGGDVPPSSAAMLLTVVMACRLEHTVLLLAGTVWEPSSTPKVWTVVPIGLRTSHADAWESAASRNNGSARRTRPALQRDGCTAASCRARPVVSTVLTVTADSCSHVMGTGAVRMRK